MDAKLRSLLAVVLAKALASYPGGFEGGDIRCALLCSTFDDAVFGLRVHQNVDATLSGDTNTCPFCPPPPLRSLAGVTAEEVAACAGPDATEHDVAASDDKVAPPAPCQWLSADEAFLRTGIWTGLPRSGPYRATPLGGNHVHRAVPSYSVSNASRETKPCNKTASSSNSHTPGIMVHW